jgi:gentisate 1,2-dioxygenase
MTAKIDTQPEIQKQDLQKDIQFYEYSRAANPVDSGTIAPMPFAELASALHETGPTAVHAFDLSSRLDDGGDQTPGPATSPNLSASFIHILPQESIETRVTATSELFYVIRGKGQTDYQSESISWQKGDFIVLPGGAGGAVARRHSATEDAALYWVSDAPLLIYLGVTPSKSRFAPALYKASDCERELARVANDPASRDRNRVSILLGNKNFPQTMTVTHTLWAMFGLLPIGAVQPAHRHNSVALDLILDCQPGCYTLVSRHIDDSGQLINPVRQDWKPNSAFITPPYFWHSHHNESGHEAKLIPIQDAGLQTYMRTLNIQFAHPKS